MGLGPDSPVEVLLALVWGPTVAELRLGVVSVAAVRCKGWVRNSPAGPSPRYTWSPAQGLTQLQEDDRGVPAQGVSSHTLHTCVQ